MSMLKDGTAYVTWWLKLSVAQSRSRQKRQKDKKDSRSPKPVGIDVAPGHAKRLAQAKASQAIHSCKMGASESIGH